MKVMAAIQVALPVLLRRRWPHTWRRRRRSSPSHDRVIEIRDKIPSSLLDLLREGHLGVIDFGPPPMFLATMEEVGDDDVVGITENAMQILQALKELKLNQNDQGFRVLKNLGIPEPDPQFICPISGMLMKDPVIVDSGKTYDAESILKLLDEGNITCPITGEEPSLPIQNRVMKNIIADWCKTTQNSFFQEMEEASGSGSEQKPLCEVQDLQCPLSGKLMINPVVISSGQTFDEGNILKWLKIGYTQCPLTVGVLSEHKCVRKYRWSIDFGCTSTWVQIVNYWFAATI